MMLRYWKECELCSYKENIQQKNIYTKISKGKLQSIPWENMEKIWPRPYEGWQLVLERSKVNSCHPDCSVDQRGITYQFGLVDLQSGDVSDDVLYDSFGQSFYTQTVKCLGFFTDIRELDYHVHRATFVRLNF